MKLKPNPAITISILTSIFATVLCKDAPSTQGEESLKNIQSLKVRNGSSIFFIDTTVLNNRRAEVVVDARIACAVESAARLHLERDVYILYTYPGYATSDGSESDEYIRRLLSYDNINFAYINIPQFLNHTPAAHLINNKTMEYSKHKIAHYSDLLRLVTLWRYGGIYLDLDVVVLKSFQDLPPNFIGAESDEHVSSSVLGFHNDGAGQKYLTWLLKGFVEHYDYKLISSNGRILFTRFVNNLCKTEKIGVAVDSAQCGQLNVYPKEYFSPVIRKDWKMYFQEKSEHQVGNLTRHAYVAHMWGRLSHNEKLPATSKAPYLGFGRKYCPGVLRKIRKFF